LPQSLPNRAKRVAQPYGVPYVKLRPGGLRLHASRRRTRAIGSEQLLEPLQVRPDVLQKGVGQYIGLFETRPECALEYGTHVKSVLFHANRLQAVVLTGDSRLRREATEYGRNDGRVWLDDRKP
jgi:hypothetical protein